MSGLRRRRVAAGPRPDLTRLCDVIACPHRRLDAVGNADPLEDGGEVRLDRLLADSELAGNELVGEPTGNQLQNLALAIAQLVASSAASGADQRTRRPWRKRRFTLGGGTDAADQLVGLGIFEEIADGAGVECMRISSRSENEVRITT